MRKRLLKRAFLIAIVLGLAGFGGWLLTLPAAPAAATAPAIARAETEAMLAALRPPRARRPVVAIIGINDATEVTDYLMPYGILRRADVADVTLLATGPGPVRLFPALRVRPQATTAAFDARHPGGADYVIVPQMEPQDDPAALAWIRAQAAKGATVIGVCAGAVVVANAGLLDGRRATTHWYYLDALRDHPVRYVADRRLVADRRVMTTTGITASMPAMLTLIEAIAGRTRSEAVARGLGAARWDARHASAAFQLTRPFALTVTANRLAFWNHERLGIRLKPGMDEIALALVADAWSRTYRSRALTYAASAAPVTTHGGLAVVPDEVTAEWPEGRRIALTAGEPAAQALDRTLAEIGARYGARTMDLVATQLEYPR